MRTNRDQTHSAIVRSYHITTHPLIDYESVHNTATTAIAYTQKNYTEKRMQYQYTNTENYTTITRRTEKQQQVTMATGSSQQWIQIIAQKET